jgi:iron complex outermembrane receptor protein
MTPFASTLRFAAGALAALAVGAAAAQSTQPEPAAPKPPEAAASAPAQSITITGERARELARSRAQVGVLGERPLLDTPFSIKSVSRELIESQSSRTLYEAVRSDASVKNLLNAGGYSTNLSVRGFEISDSSWDGLPGGFALGYQDFPLALADAVEITKGPASVLLGTYSPSSSVVGSVNYVPKRAPASGSIRRVSFGVQTGGAVSAAADLGGRFGADDALGYRVNVFTQHGGLALDNLEIEESGALLSGEWRLSPRARLIAEAGVIRSNKSGYTDVIGLDAGVAIPAPPKGRVNVSMPWADWNANRKMALLRHEWQFAADWKLSVAGTTSRHDFDYISAGFPLVTNVNGDATLFVSDATPLRSKGSTVNATLSGKATTGALAHELIVAASRDRLEDVFSALCDYGGPYATNIYRPVYVAKPACVPLAAPTFVDFKSSDYTVDNLRAIDTITLGRASVMLGVGRIRIDERGLSFSTGSPENYRKSKTTPLAAALFKPQPDMTAYVSYGEGFRQGGTAPQTASNAFENLPPRESRQTEAGFKWEPGKLQLAAALFRVQDALEFTNAANVYVQDGRQVHRGFELSVSGAAAPGLDLLASLMLLRPRIDNGDPAVSGNEPTGVPRTSVSVYANYRLPFAPALALSAGAQHKSAQFFDLANTQRIDGYTVFDAGLSIDLKPLAGVPGVVRLNVDNVSDKAYWSSVSYGCCLSRGEPRTVKLSAAFSL